MSLLDLVNERKESLDVSQSRRESEAEEAQVRAQVSGSDYNPSGSSTLSLDHSTSVFGTDGAQIIPCVLGLSLAFQTYTGKCFHLELNPGLCKNAIHSGKSEMKREAFTVSPIMG